MGDANVVFLEPSFPDNQKQFVRGLHEVGATVIGIGERPKDWLDGDVAGWLAHYEQVGSVVDEDRLFEIVRGLQQHVEIHRLEAAVEAHVMAAARVREACGIPGTSTRTAFLCRDKPAMKEVLRSAGIRCAASTAARSGHDVRDFANAVGFPVVLKPAAGAGASGAERVNAPDELDAAIARSGVDHGVGIAVEEFVEGHEGFYDTITVDGQVAMDFATHYYPNVLEAMRTRWISPQFVTTNRLDDERSYDELREMGRAVIAALDIGTSATHMEWFAGPKGLYFSEIGCRPPGVRCWDLYAAGNDIDIYREWALAVVHGAVSCRPSRRFAAGIIALRPDRDGAVTGYDGLGEIQDRYGEWIIDAHLPPAGTPTQPVEAGYMANAWVRMRHPDYDALRSMLSDVGRTVQVHA
jgi:formate-dependent phosphoribosylglycinamide formyltransferase (GAR transformylase)